jgi:hypothetical protein
LTGGSPVGGVYSGSGVNSNVFDPSLSGYGVFTIVYTYADVNGCSASSQQSITVGCAANEELDPAFYSVYPNPSTGLLVLEIKGQKLNDLKIYDAAGKLVFEQLPSSQNGFSVLDLGELSCGVYSLEIIVAGKKFRERVILTE